MARKIIRVVWLLLIVDIAAIVAAGSLQFNNQTMLVLTAAMSILSLLVLTTWLIVYYRKCFRYWWAWVIPPLLFIFSSYVTQKAIPISLASCSCFFTLLEIVSIWATGLTSAIFLWYNDVGIRIIGWSSVGAIWLVALAWRIHGNLLFITITSFERTDTQPPLWWIYPLFPVIMWLIPLSLLSFIIHSIRIMYWEFQGKYGR